MITNNKYLVAVLLFLLPGIAHAHDPLAGILTIGGIFLIPGVVAAIVAKGKSFNFAWFFASIPLAVVTIWMILSGYIPFLVGIFIPFTLIPIVIFYNVRIEKKAIKPSDHT